MNDNPPVPSAEDGHQPPQGVFDGETGAVRDAVEEDNHKLRREMETLREHMTRQVKAENLSWGCDSSLPTAARRDFGTPPESLAWGLSVEHTQPR